MQITEAYFHAILADLIEDNPIACQGVLSIMDIVFTETVETLAVTLSEEPHLLVNLKFLEKNAQTEREVQAVILHEFLHVLLNHTEQFKEMDQLTNIALDSIINAIIHRSLGKDYSGFMSRYYADMQGLKRILRPITEAERPAHRNDPNLLQRVWMGLYDGKLVADDILSVAKDIGESVTEGMGGSPDAGGMPSGSGTEIEPGKYLLGGHNPGRKPLPEKLRKALDEALQSMNGHDIWRCPKARGIGANAYESLIAADTHVNTLWEATAWRALRDCLIPDSASRAMEMSEIQSMLPVLTSRDKRAFLKSLWSPFLPESIWESEHHKPIGSAQVYLDVSGSMYAELQAIVGLLSRLRRYIRVPFWAFSDKVAPATIENGILKTQTTGGTSINCVLEHIAKTRPGKAIIVTDGYIEPCRGDLLAQVKDQNILALVSRDGSDDELVKARIRCVQLEGFKK